MFVGDCVGFGVSGIITSCPHLRANQDLRLAGFGSDVFADWQWQRSAGGT
jgi:hypothetical protein